MTTAPHAASLPGDPAGATSPARERSAACPGAFGYSIGRRLSWQLAWQTVLGLGVLCAGIYAVTYMLFDSEQQDQLRTKVGFVQEIMRASAYRGGEAEVARKLDYYAPRRPNTFLEVRRADGSLLFRDSTPPGKHWRSMDFETGLPGGQVVRGRFA
jgi:two-component system heavy metal sensor histidine kinase CusS